MTALASLNEHGIKLNPVVGGSSGEGEGENDNGGVEELDVRETRRLADALIGRCK